MTHPERISRAPLFYERLGIFLKMGEEGKEGNFTPTTFISQVATTLRFLGMGFCFTREREAEEVLRNFIFPIMFRYQRGFGFNPQEEGQIFASQVERWLNLGAPPKRIKTLIGAVVNTTTLMDPPMYAEMMGPRGTIELSPLSSISKTLTQMAEALEKKQQEELKGLKDFVLRKKLLVDSMIRCLKPKLPHTSVGIPLGDFSLDAKTFSLLLPLATLEYLDSVSPKPLQDPAQRSQIVEEIGEMLTATVVRYPPDPEGAKAILTAFQKWGKVSENKDSLKKEILDYLYPSSFQVKEKLMMKGVLERLLEESPREIFVDLFSVFLSKLISHNLFPLEEAKKWAPEAIIPQMIVAGEREDATNIDWAQIIGDARRVEIMVFTSTFGPATLGHKRAIWAALEAFRLWSKEEKAARFVLVLPLLETPHKDLSRVGPLESRKKSAQFILAGFPPDKVLFSLELQPKFESVQNTPQKLQEIEKRLEALVRAAAKRDVELSVGRIIAIDELSDDPLKISDGKYDPVKFDTPPASDMAYLQELPHLFITRSGFVMATLPIIGKLFENFPNISGVASTQGSASSTRLFRAIRKALEENDRESLVAALRNNLPRGAWRLVLTTWGGVKDKPILDQLISPSPHSN